MHWTEIVALVIVVGALIPVAVLLWYVAMFGRLAYMSWSESKRIDMGREYRCEQGTFVREHQGWVAMTQFDGRPLRLDARDQDGAPDGTFLRRLPRIIANLPQFERLAREQVHELSGGYRLDSILSPARSDDDYDFALAFEPDEQHKYEVSLFVNFKDDLVVGFLAID